MVSVLLIANPASGKYKQSKIDRILSLLRKKSDNVEVALTEYRGHAEIIAKESAADIIIAAGGDGMINETARGVVGTNKYFYALPLGTINVFCKEYGIGRNPYKAVEKLDFKNLKKIPVGYVGDKLFLLMAGFGFDAHVVKKVERHGVTFRPLKTAIHFMYGFPAFFSDKYNKINLYKTGKNYGFYHGVFAVAASYAGTYKLGKIDENLINAFLVQRKGRFALFNAFASLFFRFGFNGTHISSNYFKVDGVGFCQLDGEYVDLDSQSNYISFKKDAINFLSPKKIN